MNQHTVVRAAGVTLALLAGAQVAAAPAWAEGPGGGAPAPVAGEDPPLLRTLFRPPLQPLCVPPSVPSPAPPSADTPSPLPALVNVGVQDIGVLSDAGPRACAGNPVERALSRVVGLPAPAGGEPVGP
ncbi:hypothetical protein ABT104_12390 [Streptomyces mobaraensis]|uniref:hypothetical protein n=1 Tax=Streptomyces mobaraensis TaxID=35621 RepID=UPI00332191A1